MADSKENIETFGSDPGMGQWSSIFHKLPKWLLPLSVVIFTAIIYNQAIFNGFTKFDDAIYVTDNSFIRDFSWKGVLAIFTSFSTCNYHPFTTITYLFEYKFFQLDPLPYHALNVLLHLANTWLVYTLAERLSGKKITAFAVAVFFGIHPMHVESVAWISERKDVLYSFFFLLALLFYISYLESGFNRKYYLYMFLCFIASVLSKSAAVSLPVLLILLDIYKKRQINAKILLEKVPLFVVAAFFGVINILAQASGDCIDVVTTPFGFINRIFLCTSALASYIIRLVFPVGLSGMHYFPVMTDGFFHWQYYASLPFVLIIGWFIARRSSIRREMIFGFSFFLCTIFLMLQIISVGSALVAERYTYISYIGLFYIAGQGLSAICEGQWKNIAFMGLIIVVCVFSGLTWSRISVWKNDNTIYSDMIAKNTGSPYCFYPYYVIGLEKYKEGDFKGAMQDFNESILLDPGYPDAYNARGGLFMQFDNPHSALSDFNAAIRLDPGLAIAYNNRASLKATMGDFRGAIADYNSFLQMTPGNPRAYADRGMVRLNLGDSLGACADFKLSAQKGNDDALKLLGLYCH